MNYLPIFVNVYHRPCIVFGGGAVATRKVQLLLRADASVTVISPDLCPELEAKVRDRLITHIPERFSESIIADCDIVIAATDDADTNRRISNYARRQHIPVNVVDQPELCSFIMPSILDRNPVLLAVSSGGAAPVLARLLRARLEALIPAGYGRLAKLVEEFRGEVKARFKTSGERRRFWEHVLQGPIQDLAVSGNDQAARHKLAEAIAQTPDSDFQKGEIYIVDAGPGDPDLLTFRGLRLMQQAEVILYDRRIPGRILDLVRRDAERIYIGEQQTEYAMSEEEVNQLLIQHAGKGKRVLRLFCGDSLMFDQAAGELETLKHEGITLQVVPGVAKV